MTEIFCPIIHQTAKKSFDDEEYTDFIFVVIAVDRLLDAQTSILLFEQ